MSKLNSGRYSVWIKIDDTLPWFELEGSFETKKEARVAARQKLNLAEIKIANMSMLKRESETHLPLVKIRSSH